MNHDRRALGVEHRIRTTFGQADRRIHHLNGQISVGWNVVVGHIGLPMSEHAFHVHAVGKCEPPFTAGDHFNPGGKKHGLEAADGSHVDPSPPFRWHLPVLPWRPAPQQAAKDTSSPATPRQRVRTDLFACSSSVETHHAPLPDTLRQPKSGGWK
jgi:Copper/zinc superoxide dismutase (SODC)